MHGKRKITLEQGLYIAGLLALLIGIPFVLMYLSRLDAGILPPCVLHHYLGVYCPGCGGSRALKAFLEGHFLLSLYYHPLVAYTAVIYSLFMGSQTICICSRGRIKGMRFHNWFLYTALCIVVLNCIIKNILKFGFGIIVF